MVPRRQWHRAEWVGASSGGSSSGGSNVTAWRRHQNIAVCHPRSSERASESLRHSAEEHSGGEAGGRAASFLLTDWLTDWTAATLTPLALLPFQIWKWLLVEPFPFPSRYVSLLFGAFSQLACLSVGNNVGAAGASRAQWLAGCFTSLLPHGAANCLCVAMVPSGNIPPAAAAAAAAAVL